MSQRPSTQRFLPAVAAVLLLVTATFAYAAAEPDLVAAVRMGDLAAARDLIAGETDVDAPQGDGATALHWAAHRGDLAAAELLIEAGADVDAANALGATPLWLAARNGDAPVVERLLDAGANANVTLRMGETPLMGAARSGSLPVVEMLVDHGADVNAAERERGQTALMWAAAQQHSDIVRLLAERGADPHARTRVWEQLENTAGNTNTSGNFRMRHGGSTALLFAARNGDVETARALVAAGADVDDTAAAGASALVIAAHSGHGPFGIYLLEQGADPNAADAGYTALHAAILRGQAGLAEALLGYGADLNALVERGTPGRRFSADFSIRHQAVGANAFWLAARYGELETLRRLADWGGDPQVSPANRVSSLKAAIGIPQISQEDRRNRVDAPDSVEHVDQEQTTLDLARIVLDLGVEVNQTDDRGNTALHDAVRTGFAALVDLLALHDADLDALNDRGQTPLVLAETSLPVPGTNGLRSTQPEIAARLRELGADD